MPDRLRSEYVRALVASRASMFSIEQEAGRRIADALDTFVARLRARLNSIPPADVRRRAAELSRDVVATMADEFRRSVEANGTAARSASFSETSAIWREAGERVAAAEGLDYRALLGGVRVPPATMLGVWESVGSPYTWRTLLAAHTDRFAQEAGIVVREAIVAGQGPDELARGLRRYVVGAEDLRNVFPEGTIDLRKIPPHLQDSARRMRFNAERLAFTEIHNARGEAEVAHMLSDPLVEAVEWALSPNRGTARVPDICDVLARQDAFGLGPGIYPVGQVPPPPHPYDRCERHPVARPAARAGEPKINPPQRDPGPVARMRGMPATTDANRERLEKDRREVMRVSGEIWSTLEKRLPPNLFAVA